MSNHLDSNAQFLILNMAKQIEKLEKYLASNWLPTIDIDALLSVIFTCFISVPDVEASTNRTIGWLISEGFEFKELSDVQNLSITAAVKDVMQDIYDELLQQGFLVSEYFPYEYKQTYPDKSVVLAKIGHT